jgi:hypothetical protein
MSTRLSRIIPVNERPIEEQVKYYEKQLEEINKKKYLSITDFKTYKYCKNNLKRLQKKKED